MKNRASTILALLMGASLAVGFMQPASADQGITVIMDPTTGSQAFTDAINAKDIDRLTGLYSEDAVMIVAGGVEVRGRDAIHAFFEQAVDSIDHLELETLFRLVAEDTMLTRTQYTVYYKSADGSLIPVKAGGNEVARKQEDGSWLYVIDHHFGGSDVATYHELNGSASTE